MKTENRVGKQLVEKWNGANLVEDGSGLDHSRTLKIRESNPNLEEYLRYTYLEHIIVS
jgi:hypothetical protein